MENRLNIILLNWKENFYITIIQQFFCGILIKKQIQLDENLKFWTHKFYHILIFKYWQIYCFKLHLLRIINTYYVWQMLPKSSPLISLQNGTHYSFNVLCLICIQFVTAQVHTQLRCNYVVKTWPLHNIQPCNTFEALNNRH